MPPRPRAKALRFTHLHLENWRNFTRVDVDLERRVFLLGPNASGKSNLLDAFRFLHELVAVGGGFRQAVQGRGGVSTLRCLAARRYPEIVVSVGIGNDEEPSLWTYELHFTQDNRQRPVVTQEAVTHLGRRLFQRPEDLDREDRERLTQTYLEQVNENRNFREPVDFFESVRYLHVVPQLVRDPDRSIGRSDDPFGGDILEQIAKTNDRTQHSRLRKIESALRVAVPQLKELELKRDERGTPHLRGKYEHWRSQGAWQGEDSFSDGTLRLFGLLWALLDGQGPLLLEEPELSLHPEVVKQIPALFTRLQRRSGRQVIVSSHSTDLLTDPGIGLDEVLLLQPGKSGTIVEPTSSFSDARELLDAGLSLVEIVMPRVRPRNISQLALFDE